MYPLPQSRQGPKGLERKPFFKFFFLIPSLLLFVIARAQSVTVGLLGPSIATNVWSGYGLFATVWDKLILESQYLSLYRARPPTWTWLPCLAEGFPSPFSEENGYWAATVKLKAGILWSDGTPFTAEDVVFTYRALLTEVEGIRLASLLGGQWTLFCPESLVSVEEIDEHQVKFLFLRFPSLREWAFGVLACPIVQRDYWEPKFQAALQTEDPAGSLFGLSSVGEPVLGGYQAVAWEPGSFVVLERNPVYYASGETIALYEHGGAWVENPSLGYSLEAYGGPKGQKVCELREGPYFAELVYQVFPSVEAALSALEEGEIAALLFPPGLTKKSVENVKNSGTLEVITNPGLEFFYLAFNLRRKPMDEKAFRRALNILIDRESLCQSFPGELWPLYGPVPEVNIFWSAQGSSLPGETSSMARIAYAVELLKGAGFSWDAEPKVVDSAGGRARIIGVLPDGEEVPAPMGFRLPNGEPCPDLQLLTVASDFNPLMAELASFIEERCKELAIPISVNLVSIQSLFERIWGGAGFDFDLYLFSWPIGDPGFPDYLYFFWHSSQDVPGGFNTAGYRNPLYDRVAEAFFWSQSPEEAREHAVFLQKILEEDLPYLFLAMPAVREVVRMDRLVLPYKTVLGGLGCSWPATTIQTALGE